MKALRIARFAFLALALGFAAWFLADQWRSVQLEGGGSLIHLSWAPIAGATALVLAVYTLLIQLWRLVLSRWDGSRLPFVEAARVWTVSNLGRFIPGRVAQIGAMAWMARERGVSAVAATGSALLNTLINIAAGLAVALAAGGRLLEELRPGARGAALMLVVLAAAGLVVLPWVLPRAAAIAARLLGREDYAPPNVPPSAIWLTAAGNVGAWLMYGLAFRLFTQGVLGSADGALPAYIAVFSGSYIIGYVVLLAPGGLVAREAALVAGMVALGLATTPQATVVAVTSRLWLTVVEVVPGLCFLAHSAVRRGSTPTSGDATT